MNQLDFKGRTAVVTGGAQGIGAAIVKRLQTSGAKVVIWDLDGSPKVDVADPASVQAAAERAVKELGKVDVLVNNAGIAGMAKPVVDYPIDEWKRVIDIDLTGPFLCCRALAPHMIKAGYGRIVNIASVAGKEGNPNAAAYGAAKGGLITFIPAAASRRAIAAPMPRPPPVTSASFMARRVSVRGIGRQGAKPPSPETEKPRTS